MLGSETGGSGRAGEFWKGWDGGEQGADQHLSGLAPAFMENVWEKALLGMTHQMGTRRKTFSFPAGLILIHPRIWGSLGLCAAPWKPRWEQEASLGQCPWIAQGNALCASRSCRICWVQGSGALLRLSRPQILPLSPSPVTTSQKSGDHLSKENRAEETNTLLEL